MGARSQGLGREIPPEAVSSRWSDGRAASRLRARAAPASRPVIAARVSRVQAYAFSGQDAAFTASQARFTMMVAWLGDDHNAGMTHAQVEERLHTDGLALLRQLFQDSLDLRASREPRLHEVCDADGVERGTAEDGRERALATRFGQVIVARIAYRGRGLADLHPADAVLNLPAEKHSHGYASWRRSRPPAARSP